MVRQFARLHPGAPPFEAGYFGVPSAGMCLNVFLVLRQPDDPHRALLGRVAPDPRWEEVGALTPARLERIGDRWMLPSSQLLLMESPAEGARRLGSELLGTDLTALPAPQVFSETYEPARGPKGDLHWDLHFIFDLKGASTVPKLPLWNELEYVPIERTPRSAIARSHGDILELVGLRPMN
jgi:hypothetical protein